MKLLSIFQLLTFSLLIGTGLKASSCVQDLNKELFYAIRESNIEKVRSLIEQGANVNGISETGSRPLHVSTAYKSQEGIAVTKMLIAANADVNARATGCFQSKPPIYWAALHDNVNAVYAFAIAGVHLLPNTNLFGKGTGYNSFVQLCQDPINFLTQYHTQQELNRLLLFSAEVGSSYLVQLLLNRGAHVVSVDAKNRSVFDLAVMSKNNETINVISAWLSIVHYYYVPLIV